MSSNLDIPELIESLRKEIVLAERAYYVENRPIMSDGEFDEKLKELTRGNTIDAQVLAEFVKDLDMPDEAKQALAELTPMDYTGDAQKLAGALEKLI